MPSSEHRILILDDYQAVSQTWADWSELSAIPITVLTEAIPLDKLVETLQPYDIIHAMRERTKFDKKLLEQLPKLKFITTTGPVNRGIDLKACTELGIVVSGTGASRLGASYGTVEQTWALLLALSRRIIPELESVRAGNWQTGVATSLHGKTLGLLGLGRLGTQVSVVAKAFGMEIQAWSPNLDEKRASEAGVKLAASKEELFTTSDFVSIHMVLAESTKGIVGLKELNAMKPTAYLINTSRGPLVDEAALLKVLTDKRIAGAGLDVFDLEPLPRDHSIRTLDNVVLSPHMGYVDDVSYKSWWPQTVENIQAFLSGQPVRLIV